MALGKQIGKVKHSFSIKNHAGEQVKLSITFDFSACTDQDLKSWLVSDRTIAFQRPTRLLSASEIEELDGTTILANEAGRKVKSRAERIAELTAVGIPKKLAELAVDNPDSFATIMADLNNKTE